jgi:hypothetical protein
LVGFSHPGPGHTQKRTHTEERLIRAACFHNPAASPTQPSSSDVAHSSGAACFSQSTKSNFFASPATIVGEAFTFGAELRFRFCKTLRAFLTFFSRCILLFNSGA